MWTVPESVSYTHLDVYKRQEPNRGKRNDSRNLIFVAREIAQIKGITEEEVIAVTEENAEKLLLR